jgi:hypothetical protein
MAKSLLSIKRKGKPRVTRSEAYLVNLKYLGDEPTFTKPLTQAEYGKALSWYNYMCTNSEAREYLTDYLKANGFASHAKELKRVPDTWIPSTAAWAARLIMRGYMLPDNGVTTSFIDEQIKEALTRAKKEEPTVDTKPKPSIQDRIREKGHDIIGEIEEMIDKEEIFSLYDWLKAREIPAVYAPMIIQHYGPWLMELIEAHNGDDEQLNEAYKHMTKKQLAERIKFFDALIDDAEKYGNVAKKTRAPRKPRAQSKEKILKNLKYQKEDNTFKIASINPEKILGAQELWCFNTKYKVLTVFRALDRGGLQVKRSSITGYDEKTSKSRGCGRQAEKTVYNVMNSGKINLRKLMDDLKSEKPLQERINENTILLRVL